MDYSERLKLALSDMQRVLQEKGNPQRVARLLLNELEVYDTIIDGLRYKISFHAAAASARPVMLVKSDSEHKVYNGVENIVQNLPQILTDEKSKLIEKMQSNFTAALHTGTEMGAEIRQYNSKQMYFC